MTHDDYERTLPRGGRAQADAEQDAAMDDDLEADQQERIAQLLDDPDFQSWLRDGLEDADWENEQP